MSPCLEAEFAGTSSGWQAIFYSKSTDGLQDSLSPSLHGPLILAREFDIGLKCFRRQTRKKRATNFIRYYHLTMFRAGGSKPVEKAISEDSSRQGWIEMVGVDEAAGPLKDVYVKMRAQMGSRPAVYSTPAGDAPNIVKSHSLEPEGLRLAFGISSAIHWSDKCLPWAKREMINTVTSRANNCFY